MRNIFALSATATMLAGLNSVSAEEMPVIDEVRHNHFNACVSYALQEVSPDAVHQSELHAFRDGRSYEVFNALKADGGFLVSVEITGQGPETMHVRGWQEMSDNSRASTYIILDKDNIFDFNTNFLAISTGGKSSNVQEQVRDRTEAVLSSIRKCRTPGL